MKNFLSLLLGLLLGLLLALVSYSAVAQPQAQSDTQPDAGALPVNIQNLVQAFADPEDAISVTLDQGVLVLAGQWSEEGTPKALADALVQQPGVIALRDTTTVATLPSGFEPTVSKFESLLESFLAYLPLIGAALVIIAAFWLLARVINLIEPGLARVIDNPWIRSLLLQVLRLIVMIVGVVLALETLNATALVGSILGAAGIVGIAVGFAFRDLIENYISSLMLGIRQPFRPGDHVSIDGKEGIVARLTTRSTIIMTFDGNRMRIPNNQVFKSTITNFSAHPKRRFSFQVDVGYNVDLANAVNLGVDILASTPGVLDDPAPTGRVKSLDDSTVAIEFFAWVDQNAADFGRARSQSLIRVKQAFEDEQLDMPEPTYNLRITSGAITHNEAGSATTPPKKMGATAVLHEEQSSEADYARTQAALEAEQSDDNLITPDAKQSQLDG